MDTQLLTIDSLWQLATSQLARAYVDHRHPMRSAVLTTSSRPYPASRWVVHRGIDTKGCIVLYTDSRSPKVAQIDLVPQGQLLYYHPRKRLQIRIDTIIEIDTCSEDYKKHKARLGDRVIDYSTSLAPGTVAEDYSQTAEVHFAVMRCMPMRYDVLVLGKPHQRAEYTCINGKWEGKWLVP